MYEYRGLQDMFFMTLYGGVAFFAVLACLYLSQVVSIVIIAFLVWRVETLQELKEN